MPEMGVSGGGFPGPIPITQNIKVSTLNTSSANLLGGGIYTGEAVYPMNQME
jgi:hypothetical protein